MKTQAEISKFGKHPILEIYEIDEDGIKSEKPVIQFGLKKAEAILSQVEAVKNFLATKGEKANETSKR